jgi:hypothetical protein
MKATKTDIVGKTETKKKQKEVERKKYNFDLYKHFFRISTFFLCNSLTDVFLNISKKIKD